MKGIVIGTLIVALVLGGCASVPARSSRTLRDRNEILDRTPTRGNDSDDRDEDCVGGDCTI